MDSVKPKNKKQINFMEAVKERAIITNNYIIIGARFQLSFNGAGGISIDDMRVPTKLQRYNKKSEIAKERAISLSDFGLSEIAMQADKHAITLYSDCFSVGDIPINKLREIYVRHGFRTQGSYEMVRKPQTPSSSPKITPLV